MSRDNELLTRYLNHLVVERGAAKNTVAAYTRDLEKYLTYRSEMGETLEESGSTEVVTNFIASLRKAKLSESSVARTVVTVRNFHKFLANEVGIADPSQEIEVPAIPQRLPKALNVAEITALIESFPNEGMGLRDRALVELLYASGARVSELVNIAIDDLAELAIDDKRTMTVKVSGKGGKERYVPVGKFAQEAISNYLVRLRPTLVKNTHERALFLNTSGGQLTRQSAWAIVKSAAERVQLSSKVSPHSLRHSFATHLLDGGADVRVVQELLGHASVTTTQIYTLVTIDKLRESYATAHPRSR